MGELKRSEAGTHRSALLSVRRIPITNFDLHFPLSRLLSFLPPSQLHQLENLGIESGWGPYGHFTDLGGASLKGLSPHTPYPTPHPPGTPHAATALTPSSAFILYRK